MDLDLSNLRTEMDLDSLLWALSKLGSPQESFWKCWFHIYAIESIESVSNIFNSHVSLSGVPDDCGIGLPHCELVQFGWGEMMSRIECIPLKRWSQIWSQPCPATGDAVGRILRRSSCLHLWDETGRLQILQVWQALPQRPQEVWTEIELARLDDTFGFHVTWMQFDSFNVSSYLMNL